MIELKNFRNISNEESLAVFVARSHPEISHFITGRPANFEAHKNFINYLKTQNNKEYFMVLKAGKFIGVISFVNIANGEAEIGFYKNPNLVGIGKILIETLLQEAQKLGLKTLNARVMKENVRSFKLLKSFGFLQDGGETEDGEFLLNKKIK